MSRGVDMQALGMTYLTAGGQEVVALEEFSAYLAPSSFTAIVGPSGCGKSTLLQILAGLSSPSSGRALLGDRPIKRPSRSVGVVFQEPSLFPWRTVLDNVAWGLQLAGVKKPERHRLARSWIERVGLGGFEHAYPSELSGGMQQRGAIARALATEPDLLLLDEPFGALDEQTRLLLGAELTQVWASAQTTVLLVTHSVQEAILLADQVLLMSARPGRLKETFTVDLPRPRGTEIIGEPGFVKLQAAIWQGLAVEANTARQARRGIRERQVAAGSGGRGAARNAS